MTADARSPAADVTFLLDCAEPEMGMERAALRLIKALPANERIAVTVLFGRAPDIPGVVSRTLGAEPRHLRKVIRVWRILQVAMTCRANTVVVVGAWVAAPWLTFAPRSRRTIVWEHSLLREKWSHAKSIVLLNLWAGLVYWRARSVVVVSLPLMEDASKFVPRRKLQMIPNLIDNEIGDPSNRAESNVRHLVMVGSLSRLKNQELLIRALPQLPADWVVQLIGDGPARIELQTLVSRLDLESRVRFLGYLPHVETLDLIRHAHALVHASFSETFGLAYFEAAQLGTPVVALNNRVAAWLIPKYVPGLTFTGSAQHLASALLERLTPSINDLRTRESAAAHRRDDFSRDDVLSDWSELLGHLPEGKPSC